MNLIKDQLRSIIVECLRKERPYRRSEPPFSVNQLFAEVAAIARTRQLNYTESLPAWNDNAGRAELHANLRGPVWDIVWDLVVEGILRPGDEHGDEFGLPNIHVTAYGKQALSGSVTPYDPEGYLNAISRAVPTVDQIIIKYITESAETLRRNCLLSSTIALGCASEKAFLLLLDAYGDALQPTDQAKFSDERNRSWQIKPQHAVFMRWYDAKLKSMLRSKGRDWITELEDALQFLFSYFRKIRNEAGHPSGVTLSREAVQSHLVIFPAYLRRIYDLIEWIDDNKPL